MMKFVEIEESVYHGLEKVAAENGYPSVEKMLTEFAVRFSQGCSVTRGPRKDAAA